jgi:hypothetical protein
MELPLAVVAERRFEFFPAHYEFAATFSVLETTNGLYYRPLASKAVQFESFSDRDSEGHWGCSSNRALYEHPYIPLISKKGLPNMNPI